MVEIPYSKSNCALLVFSHKNDTVVILLPDPKTRFMGLQVIEMNTELKRKKADGVY